MSTHEYELPVATTVLLQSRSGRVEVVAEPRETVLAQGDKIEALPAEGALRIRNGRGHGGFTVRCPVGTDVTIGTQSGSVTLHGDFGSVSVTTMSGKIVVESAEEADLRTVSAPIVIGLVRGRCRLNSATGKVSAHDVGAASAGTMSGSITIDRVAGGLKARSVSGAIHACAGGEGAIVIKTVSGKVRLELPPDCEPQTRFKTLSGHVTCGLRAGDDVLIEAMTVSGTIEVVAS